MIEVCCSIILKGSKILAVQWGTESSHPWKWEFPGGKIQVDETAEQCIVREIYFTRFGKIRAKATKTAVQLRMDKTMYDMANLCLE